MYNVQCRTARAVRQEASCALRLSARDVKSQVRLDFRHPGCHRLRRCRRRKRIHVPTPTLHAAEGQRVVPRLLQPAERIAGKRASASCCHLCCWRSLQRLQAPHLTEDRAQRHWPAAIASACEVVGLRCCGLHLVGCCEQQPWKWQHPGEVEDTAGCIPAVGRCLAVHLRQYPARCGDRGKGVRAVAVETGSAQCHLRQGRDVNKSMESMHIPAHATLLLLCADGIAQDMHRSQE